MVVRCYNEERHIGRLLDGILEQTERDVEIVVVDSGSTDRTLEIVAKYPVRLVQIRKEDFSFGYSLNAGCREAKGEILVFASAHVYPTYDDWLERLLEPFADPEVGLVYGKQRGNDTTRYSEEQVFRNWFPEISDDEQDHPFCNNANAAVRRALWEELHYDESLTGLEDVAWAKQMMQRGHRLVYVAEAEVVHVHEETPAQIFRRYEREAIALRSIDPGSRFSFWTFLKVAGHNVWSDWVQARREGKLVANLVDVPLFRLLQFWGTYRGYAQHLPISRKLHMRFYYPSDPTPAKPVADVAGRFGATPIDYVASSPQDGYGGKR